MRAALGATQLVAVALAALLHAGQPAAASFTAYQGEARSPADDALLYEEHHLLRRDDNGPQERLVLYRCPDGQAFARKTVRYREPSHQPEFALFDARLGYREGFDLGSSFVQLNTSSALRRESLRTSDALVVDAGFDEFVRARWDALQAGTAVRLDFLVPSRLASYGFRVRKLDQVKLHDAPASRFRLALSGVLGWFADAIEVTYRDHDRRLMRFEGVTNIRSNGGGGNVVARIDFPPEREGDASAADWRAAEREPLQGCLLGG